MKYLPIALVAVLFSSCSVVPTFDVPSCSSPEDAGLWIHSNIKYQNDLLIKSPNDTVLSKSGNCTSKAILCLAMVKQSLGIEGEIIFYDTPDGQHSTAKFPGYEFGYIEGSSRVGRPVPYYWAMVNLVGQEGTIYN
jgi:hypothetical protein